MECLLLKVTPSILVHTFEHLSVCSVVHRVAFSKHNIGCDNLLLFVNSPCFLGPSHCHLVKRDAVVPWFETMFKTLLNSVQIKFMECLLLKVTPSILVHTFNRAFIGMFYCSLSCLSKHNIGYDNLLLFVNSHCFLGPKWKQKKTSYCNVFFYVIWPVFSRSNATMWNPCKWSNIFISRKIQVSQSLYLHNFLVGILFF